MAGEHIDTLLDQLLSAESPVAKAGQNAVTAPHPIDQQLDRMLTPVQEPSELEQSLSLKYDPSKDWDTARQALDSATFGSLTHADPKLAKAKDAWEKQNGPAAVAADFVGSTAPSVVLSTLAGQGVFRAGQLASKLAGNPFFEEAARFITGQLAGSSRAARLASQATWGAGQGLTTGLYGKAMGQDEDLGSEALLGATAGPVSNMLFAPYRSNVAPEIGELARNWSRQGLGLSAAQLPGAPPMLRAVSKLLHLGKSDMSDVTASLMRSTGSGDTVLTAANLDAARAAIKSSLAKNVHPAFRNIPDDELPQRFEDALNSGALTPSQAQSVRLAQNQWANSRVLDRVVANSVDTPGVANPKALISAMRSAQYPGGMSASTAAAGSGNPVDLDVLARGSQLFVPPGSSGHGGGLNAVLGLAGGGLAAEGFEHAMPFLEQVMPHLPLLAHGATAYGAINAAAAPLALPFMASPAYRYLLTHGGVGPVANPLLPSVVSNPDYQSKVDWMKNYFAPVGSAQGASLQDVPDELQPVIASSATKYGLPADMLARQLKQESNFKNLPANKQGATGIAQFTADTAKDYGIDPTDVSQSIEGQAHYVSDLSKRFGNSGLALAAYNWGPGKVSKWLASGADPKKLPDETSNYVRTVSGLPIENWLAPGGAARITIPVSATNAPENYFTGAGADNTVGGSQ